MDRFYIITFRNILMEPEIGFMNQLTTKNVLTDLRFAAKHNFDWFEIDLDWKQNFNLKPETIRQIKKIAEESDVRLIVHAASPLPISTIIPEVRKAVFLNLKKAIALAQKVGADRLTIHPGFREMPGPAAKLSYKSLIKNLREVVRIGKQHNVTVCLENFNNNPFFLCFELEDFLRVLNSVRGLKATFDVGHANTTKTKPHNYFRVVKNFVMNMHVHDNNGMADEHKGIGEGNINFNKLFSECKNANYLGPFILEVFPYKNILRSRKLLLDLWNKA